VHAAAVLYLLLLLLLLTKRLCTWCWRSSAHRAAAARLHSCTLQ
jgi:hypothetical protein